jgi:hypothetical protein
MEWMLSPSGKKEKSKKGRENHSGERERKERSERMERKERKRERKERMKEKKGSEIRFLILMSIWIFCDQVRAAIRTSNFNCLNTFIIRTNLIIIFLSYQIN